jgi:hypothetical protein
MAEQQQLVAASLLWLFFFFFLYNVASPIPLKMYEQFVKE